MACAVFLTACQASKTADPPHSPAAHTPATHTQSTATTPSSPTATPTNTASDDEAWARVPKQARAHTFAGAQAFAEFYVTQLNHAWRSADPDAIRSYATERCKTCRNFVVTAESMATRDEHYVSDPFVIRAAAWLPESARNTAVVNVVLDQAATKIINATGATVQSVPQDKGESSFDIRWAEGHWRVNEIRLVVVK